MRQRTFSPHFVDLIDYCGNEQFHVLITTHVGNSLQQLRPCSATSALKVMQQATDALHELHRIGFVHRYNFGTLNTLKISIQTLLSINL